MRKLLAMRECEMGISSGDTFRRLVAKTLARQFQDDLRAAVFPYNFGLCNRSGTDAAVHLLRSITDLDPRATITQRRSTASGPLTTPTGLPCWTPCATYQPVIASFLI